MSDNYDEVTVVESDQFIELTSWLRGEDLHERMLPAPEIRHGMDARQRAFIDMLHLYMQAGGAANEVLERSTDRDEISRWTDMSSRSEEEILLNALFPFKTTAPSKD